MTDIEKLIKTNIEVEGLLRVLLEHESSQARELLSQKFDEYSALMAQFLHKEDAMELSEPSELSEIPEVEQPESPAEEVKEQEAEEAELEPDIQDEAAQIVAEEKAEPNTKLLKAFTLNDRFRFRRELFGGNDADLSDTLMILAGMDSYDEAADFLLNDMMWDKNNPSVVDFMAILAQHMPR